MAEAPFCKDQTVYVVDGANSAGQAVMHFAKSASKVVMLVRAGNFAGTMSKYLSERILSQPNVQVRFNTAVSGLDGGDHLHAPSPFKTLAPAKRKRRRLRAFLSA